MLMGSVSIYPTYYIIAQIAAGQSSAAQPGSGRQGARQAKAGGV